MKKNNIKDRVNSIKMHMGGGSKALAAAALIICMCNNTVFAEATKHETTLSDKSGYTLTPSTEKESNVYAFKYNPETKDLTVEYYEIDIKRDLQGTGDQVQYYTWKKDEYGRDVLEKSTKKTSYEVHYDSNDHYEKNSSLHVTSGTSHGSIHMDFIGNHITEGTHYGNGIYNEGTITDIVGDFIHNYSQIKDSGVNNGGSIYNSGKGHIDSIKGNFIGNFISAEVDSNGGAIRNGDSSKETKASINSIEGNFISNYARSTGKHNGYGGALYNTNSTIGTITGDFIDNQAYANKYADGGAIFNGANSTLTKIKGDFVGNSASGNQGQGGAIFDISGISNIEGNFIHNYTESTGDKHDDDDKKETPDVPVSSQGGALYELARSGNVEITGDFYGNHANSTNHESQGGAVYAKANTKDKNFTLNSDFYHNYVIGKTGAQGGAVYNEESSVVNLYGKEYFLNYAKTEDGNAFGGAIYNKGNLNFKDNAIFIQNFALNEKGEAKGGAIYNDGNITNLNNVTFSENYAVTHGSEAHGGAIYTNQDLTISANNGGISEFTNNYIQVSNDKTQEAIYVNGDKTLTLNATNKGKILFNDIINGSDGYKLKITGDNNSTVTLNNKIINANATLENVTLNLGAEADIFKDSVLTVNSGIVNTANSEFTDYKFKGLNSNGTGKYNIDIQLNSDSENDKADTFTITESSSGGFIDLSSIVVNVLENYKEGAQDEEVHIIQIIKAENENIQLKLNGDIKTVKEATAEMTSDDILAKEFGLYTTKTKNDSIKVAGWRDNLAAWAELEVDDKTAKKFTLKDGDTQKLTRDIEQFAGNNFEIIGEGSNILDVNHKNLFSDIQEKQKVSLSNLSLQNADNVNNNGDLNLNNVALEDSSVINNNKNLKIEGETNISGTITSETGGNMKLDNATVKITGKVENQKIDNNKSTTTLVNVNDFTNNALTMNGGSFEITNLGLNNLHLTDLSLNNGDINIDMVDVDLRNAQMGRITADDYTIGEGYNGKINVKDMNITSDSLYMQTVVDFADESVKDFVHTQIAEAPTPGQQWNVYSPIYKYTVEYSADGTHGNNGYFVFSRGNTPTGNASDGFNPAVLPSSVASEAGGYAAMNQTFNYAFQHADTFSALPAIERYALINSNKYAINDFETLSYNSNEINSNGAWVKPYATFERIPLKNGPDVDTITYGTLVGIDGDIKSLKNGWVTVSTGYIGYNGSSQHYSGVTTNQNGGLLGLTQTFYKDNFFTAITASAGASVADSSTMYGTEDFAMLLSGIASKSGYSFEFKDGKFVIQPSLLLSYTFVNTFDYTNSAGVRIESDPLHSIQVRPNVKFVLNTESGWQPYISGGFVYNVMDKTETVAIDGVTDDVRLPNMSVKPYAEYGAGIQKRWKDKYTGYAQAMVRNGGRNGVALSFGFRWTLGDDNNSVEKVDSNVKKNNNFINKITKFFGEYFKLGNSAPVENNSKKYM